MRPCLTKISITMKRIERNRLYMIQAVNKVAEEFASAYAELPEFSEMFGSAAAYEQQLRELTQQKELLLQPFGAVKAEMREQFARDCAALAAYLNRVGRINKDRALRVAVNFTAPKFKDFSLQKQRVTAENLLAFYEQYESELADVPKAQELRDTVQAQLLVFVDKALVPAERRKKLGETTKAIERSARMMMDFLKEELDPMMRIFETEAPAFYLSYQNARVIPKWVGAQGNSLKVVDENDGGFDGDGEVDPAA